jgi:hypothetical protein
MASHDRYGKEVCQAAAGSAFKSSGPSVTVNYGAGWPARVDGTVLDKIAIEIESRTAKQVRGAVLDLVFHPYQNKLLILIPMWNSKACAEQCRNALSRLLPKENFRVVVLGGIGSRPNLQSDVQLVKGALAELGFQL